MERQLNPWRVKIVADTGDMHIFIAPDKVLFVNQKVLIFFLCLHENMLWYSLEAPLLMSTHNIFSWRNWKIFSQYPLLSGAMSTHNIIPCSIYPKY